MALMSQTRPILVVEDSDDDFEAITRMLRQREVAVPVVRCETGREALDYLLRRGADDAPLRTPPSLVLLDLNMPGLDGRAVLTILRREPSTRCIPVIVLTSSTDQWDVDECYDIGASTYIAKSADLEAFGDALAKVQDDWFDVATLPKSV